MVDHDHERSDDAEHDDEDRPVADAHARNGSPEHGQSGTGSAAEQRTARPLRGLDHTGTGVEFARDISMAEWHSLSR